MTVDLIGSEGVNLLPSIGTVRSSVALMSGVGTVSINSVMDGQSLD